MQALTPSELWTVGMCLVLSGFLVGLVVCLIVLRLVFSHLVTTPKKRVISSQKELRRILDGLQHLQAMLGYDEVACDPSLRDVADFVRTVQQDFGRTASLESVIQMLVAQDIELQLAARRLERSNVLNALLQPQEAVVV